MPNPHYQYVLELDRKLPTPVRLLTQAMSSWWTISVLGVAVALYYAAAMLPLGGRYLWQSRMIDTTQHAMLTWWPLLAASVLLAMVCFWAALRRLPWRWANMGAFVLVLGFATALVAQALSIGHNKSGIAAAPLVQPTGSRNPDGIITPGTTRYGDPTQRVLVLATHPASAPDVIPLEALPRWNDTADEDMPDIRIEDQPNLRNTVGFATKIRPVAYIADGTLTNNPDGTQTATPTPANERDYTALPYPGNALLAIEFTVELDLPAPVKTIVWLPFEPDGADKTAPSELYAIDELGDIGMSFRPKSWKLPFAVTATRDTSPDKRGSLTLNVVDAQSSEQWLTPKEHVVGGNAGTTRVRAVNEDNRWQEIDLSLATDVPDNDGYALLLVEMASSRLFVYAGLCTMTLGLAWLGIAEFRARFKQYSQTPTAEGRRASG